MASGGSEAEEDIQSSESEALSEDDDFPEEDTISENSEYDDFSSSESPTELEEEVPGMKMPIIFPHVILQNLTKQLSRSKFVSLLNDYVESEFFVIDGDSLLITCARNTSLSPGQSLHIFYLVEQFLFNLTSRQARYVIVFFQEFKHFYLSYPLLRCWRTQLELHLQKNTNIAVHTFPSFLCEEWQTFLKQQAPYFFMVSDEGLNKNQTLYLNMLILHALGHKIDVVLTDAQDSDHLRVYGYYIKSSIQMKKFIQENVTKFEETVQKLLTAFQTCTEPEQSFSLECIQEITGEKQVQECISLLSSVFNENCDVRVATCVFSCSLALTIHTRTENFHHQNCNDPHLTLEEAADFCRMQCLSVAMRTILPLCQRSKLRGIKGKWNRDVRLFFNLHEKCNHTALDLMREHCKKTEINWTHVSDISDDLLLKNIAYYCENEYNAGLKLEFGEKINEMYTCLWNSILKLFPKEEQFLSYELRTTGKKFLTSESSVNMEQKEMIPTGLLPMRSDIIEDYAGDAIKKLPMLSCDDPVFSSLLKKKTYDELKHWHSGRQLSDDYDRTRHEQHEIIKDKWALKRYQKHQLYNHRYGQTLGVKKATNIIVQNDQPEEKKCVYKAPGKLKQPHMKKKDQIIEDNLRKSKAIEENKEQQQWNTLASSLKKELRGNLCSGILKLEKAINSFQTHTARYRALKEALTMCFEIWLEHCRTVCEDQRDMNIAVEIMKIIQSIMANHKDMLQGEDKNRVASYLSQMGFQNLACSLKGSEVLSKEGKKTYGVGVGSARFQMKYMGPYLLRDERKDPDPRVKHFIPDTWQGYLNADCYPTEFTGLVTHLHYHEPSNFVFVTFLEKGLFHQLCKPLPGDPKRFPDSVMQMLVLILANLFGRSYLAPSRRSLEENSYQTKICLEELPTDFAAAVKEYNKKVAMVFGHCILTASKLADMEKEYQLPLTKISLSGNQCKDSRLVDHLMSHTEGRGGISPFACLSGNTDHDLMKMTNISSLMLQTAQIPEKYIPLLFLTRRDICGRKMFLNSYALDFFKHGSLFTISKRNGFNQGDAYCRLKDFTLTIASISVSMKELCEDENDPVALAFDQLNKMYSAKFNLV